VLGVLFLVGEAIVVNDLVKVYGGQPGVGTAAVDNLSFSVNEGEIFGFIGPNGAGKTTTIKMLLGLIFPTSGVAEVLGLPAGDIEVKKRLAYLPESPYFYEHMNGYEVLDFYARLFQMDEKTRKTKIQALLEQVGLARDAKRQLRQYSKGMLQRIGIAQSLLNDPDLLIFDEPTSGLDPVAHKDIQDLIISLGKQGKTVFLSSHQLTDVENVCDRVAMINRGKLVRIGSIEELLHAGRTIVTLIGAKDDLVAQLKPMAERVSVDGNEVKVYLESKDTLFTILDAVKGKAELVSVLPQRQSLEEMFVEIVREAKS
jgi:ABC-2 type transport system ATP-binding protein